MCQPSALCLSMHKTFINKSKNSKSELKVLQKNKICSKYLEEVVWNSKVVMYGLRGKTNMKHTWTDFLKIPS